MIFEELKNCELDIKKLIGFVIDGVLVMVGKRLGVVICLKEENFLFINIYCICYWFVLFCIDINELIKYIKIVEIILR